MKKVKSVLEVNIRSSEPYRREWNNKGTLNPGFEVEVVNEKNGEDIGGNDLWYQDKNGDYYWSGGFEEISQNGEAEPSIQELVNYNSSFQGISAAYRANKGNGISIAILDTGIYESHPDFLAYFNTPVQASVDFTNSSAGYLDENGHGTHVAGLTGARSNSPTGIIGMAPSCKLWNIKCQTDQGGINAQTLGPALDALLKFPVDVVNMSFNLTTNDFQQLAGKFKAIYDAGMIMVGSAGENDNLKRYSLYPAFSDYVLSVGSISKGFELKEDESFHSSVDFLVPLLDLQSCSIPKYELYKKEQGSSMAAALVSGIVALIIKQIGKCDLEIVKQELTKFSIPYTNQLTLNTLNLIKP